ncbi:TRI29 protein, partial [Polypterus senegalus]
MRETPVPGQDGGPREDDADSDEPLCDCCTEGKVRAINSCLVCVASYCEDHIKPHWEVPALRRHQLVSPIRNLEDRICPAHQKIKNLFCKSDDIFICGLCHEKDHRSHVVFSAASARAEKQVHIDEMHTDIEKQLGRRQKELDDLNLAMESVKVSATTEKEDSRKVFDELISSIQERKKVANEMIESRQALYMSEISTYMKKVQEEIGGLKQKQNRLLKLSSTDDHITVVQYFQSMSTKSTDNPLPYLAINTKMNFNEISKGAHVMKVQLDSIWEKISTAVTKSS